MRVIEHPILPPYELYDKKRIVIYYNGEPVEAYDGEPVAAALAAAGIRSMRSTAVRREPRGIFCAIGRCTDCMMIVDGVPNTRSCVTPTRDGMRVERQEGLVSPAPPADADGIDCAVNAVEAAGDNDVDGAGTAAGLRRSDI